MFWWWGFLIVCLFVVFFPLGFVVVFCFKFFLFMQALQKQLEVAQFIL